jgi:hypothetical protein
MIRIAYIICLCIGCYLSSIDAQHGISAVYAPSKVLKHKDNLLFDVPALSNEFRLAYTYQTTGENTWERFWKKPRIALNLIYVNFGNEVLGSAFSLVPELHFTLTSYKRLLLNLQFGTGIAYLTKPYDAVDNPNNNAIGSNLNNTSSLKFGIEYPWNDRFTTSLSTGIVHFSNGLSSSPNSGINIYGASFNINYKFTVRQLKDKESITTRNAEESLTYRKWIIDAQYHYGFTEHTTTGGPKYGVSRCRI